MPIQGEFGPIENIDCTVAPGLTVIKDGVLLLSVTSANKLDAWVPANCPRRATFNSEKTLGCIGCTNALIEYEGGAAEC